MVLQWSDMLYLLATEAEQVEMSPAAMIMQLGMFAVIGVAFYFMLIRPQRKKDKQVKKMLEALTIGDRVTTIGGIHGTIDQIRDDTLIIAVGQDKVKLVFARWAIRSKDEVSIANDAETLV